MGNFTSDKQGQKRYINGRRYTLGLDDAFCHNNSRNGVDRKGRRSYTAMLLFGMISTQGYEHLFSSGSRILVFATFPATEERLINRVESSEWTIIHECLIATIAHQFRMATKLMLAPENIIGRFVIARGIKQFTKYTAPWKIDCALVKLKATRLSRSGMVHRQEQNHGNTQS